MRPVWRGEGRSPGGARRGRSLVVSVGVAVATALSCGVLAAPALAQAPALSIASLADTTVQAGGTLAYQVELRNVGDADTAAPSDPTCDPNNPPVDPACLVFTASVPAGLTVTDVEPVLQGTTAFSAGQCTGLNSPGPVTVTCASADVLSTDHEDGTNYFRVFKVSVAVDGGASGLLTASFSASGGGTAGSVSTVDPTRISPAAPGFGVDAFDGQVSDASGGPFTQAGGHPSAASVSVDFNTLENPDPFLGSDWPVEPVKDVLTDLPPGLIGDSTAADRCPTPQIAVSTSPPLCSPASQVGTTFVRVNTLSTHVLLGPVPVYNMVPPPDVPARFGFNVAGTVVFLDGRLRSGSDYGVSVDADNAPEGLNIAGTTVTLWGVPADPAHDPDRACSGQRAPFQGGPSCEAGTSLKAFLRNPTSCEPQPGPVTDGLVTTARTDSWINPGRKNPDGSADTSDPAWQSASFVSHLPPAYPSLPSDWGAHQLPTGCEHVPFEPKVSFAPSPERASTSSGFAFDLSLPQSEEPAAIGEGDLKKAVVTLPTGVRVSPSSADGLQACSPAQIALKSSADANCPDASKVGSLTITTPLLPQPLTGSVYLATPHDNPFGSLIAIYLVAKGPGFVVKLAGKTEPDPVTGQLKATFDNQPQVPFSNLHLEFVGGPRAPLMTPAQCGTYTTDSQLTSWSGKTVDVKSKFDITQNSDGSPCSAPGFSPVLNAETLDPTAGGDTTFALQLTRGDGDQELSSLAVDLPTGLTGRIASAVQCPDAAANAGTCDAGSQVGSVTVGAGPGLDPFYITNGRAYLTGPYKGAPYGLAFVVPAIAGPFDLGNVIVRAALFVDKTKAQVKVVSNPLPTILQGIPLDVRDLRAMVDRPHFMINPTNCSLKHVAATVGSTQGAIAHVSSPFQARDCASLAFAPRLSLTVGARKHTRAGVSTPVSATLTMPKGDANLRATSVTLPGTLNALLPVINQACQLAAFEAGHCGNRAKIGTAVAVTPLLRDPLRGSVYFVKNPARILPDLMVALRGPIALDVTAKVSIPGGKRLGTTFDTIPDQPISKFTLRIVSGKNGPVGIATNLCSAKGRSAKATVAFRGQNGALVKVNQPVHVNGCAKASKARKAKR